MFNIFCNYTGSYIINKNFNIQKSEAPKIRLKLALRNIEWLHINHHRVKFAEQKYYLLSHQIAEKRIYTCFTYYTSLKRIRCFIISKIMVIGQFAHILIILIS